MRHDHNLTGTIFIRFANEELCEEFCDEFHGTRCAGRVLECLPAGQEMIIPPRSQWGRELRLGNPRFKEDCWQMLGESDRPGVMFHERRRR